MKNKNKKYSMVLILLFLTCGLSFGMFFSSPIVIQDGDNFGSPKSSAGEITIITPENKTYTQPDSGYYPATYGFEDEQNLIYGASMRFLDEYQGYSPGTYCWIRVDKIFLKGHRDFIKMGDAQGGSYTYGVHNFDDPPSLGTIEFYLYLNYVSGSALQRHYLQLRASDDTIAFRITIQLHDGIITYYNGTDWLEIATLDFFEWYHHSIDFNCESGINGQFTWTITDNLGNQVGQIENIEFENDLSTLDELYIGTNLGDYSGGTYWDAFGFSWDPDYNVDDNLNEGLLLSYVNTTNLDWQGYSLDGQTNKTILGNSTIPMPSDGPHNVQIFGNDTLGEIFESNVRYFTVNTSPSIDIITPENKTYTEPMTGYYPAVFGFENQITGVMPDDWILYQSSGAGYLQTLDELDGHKKVLDFYSGANGDYCYYQKDLRMNVSTGTVEFWFRTTDTTPPEWYSWFILSDGVSLTERNIRLCIRDGNVSFFNSTDYLLIDSIVSNQWYHLRIDFDMVADRSSIYLNNVLKLSNVDNYGDGSQINTIHITNHLDLANTHLYVDALGYSWDSNYNTGDNLIEGLLLSYEDNFNLDWQGYSLDGGNYLTIFGNTTLPMPEIGAHSIQVLGNDSVDTMYESNLRYFTVNTAPPDITINSPTDSQIIGSTAPNYDVLITGSYDSIWYALEGGANRTASGLSGTIDQSAWSALSDGIITIDFYANNSAGMEGSAQVMVVKYTSEEPPPTPPGIPGYNLIALVGVCCIVTLIMIKKKRGRIKP